MESNSNITIILSENEKLWDQEYVLTENSEIIFDQNEVIF